MRGKDCITVKNMGVKAQNSLEGHQLLPEKVIAVTEFFPKNIAHCLRQWVKINLFRPEMLTAK